MRDLTCISGSITITVKHERPLHYQGGHRERAVENP